MSSVAIADAKSALNSGDAEFIKLSVFENVIPLLYPLNIISSLRSVISSSVKLELESDDLISFPYFVTRR